MRKNTLPLAIRTALAALLILGGAGLARAAELRDTGRRLAQELESAIVNVKIVITLQDGNDHPMEASGTVIGPDGLTAVPLNSVDPMSLARRIRAGDADNIGGNSRVKDIKLLVDKRTEVPATVVLRDDDLNIALLRPTRKLEKPMQYIDLNNTADAQLLEQVFVLSRMGRVADRVIGAMTGEIQAIVSKPRKFYIPSSELASGGYGVPIFDANAKLIGIVLIRINIGAVDSQNDMVAIVLPAKDLKELADQAPAEAPKQVIPIVDAPKGAKTPPVKKTANETK